MIHKALSAALLLWIVFIAARGSLLALEPFWPALSIEPTRVILSQDTALTAAVVCSMVLLVTLLTRWLRPSAILLASGLVAGALVTAAAVSTGSLIALATVVVVFVLSWLLGEVVLGLLPPTFDVPIVRIPIASALGLGIAGLVLFLVAATSRLNTFAIAAFGAAILCLAWIAARDRLVGQLAQWRSWCPTPSSWFETAVVGLTTGLVAFALLTAFAPEDQTDAMRQHLPVAREIWQSGSVAEFAPMSVSTRPMQAHLLFAAAYGLGGVTAAKLVEAAVGLIAILGVAAIGWLCAGRPAAIAGATIFATMPLFLWELGHAFVDLFPVLYTVAAVLCVLLWQRDGAAGWLVCAGALSGFGFVVKLNMGLVSVALAVAILLVGRVPGAWRSRVLGVVAFGLGNVVIVPWLVRSYGITGTLPRLGSALDRFGIDLPGTSTPSDGALAPATVVEVDAAQVTSPSQVGFGRTAFDLVRGLWVLTFDGKDLGFPIIGRGEIGILPLMQLPLALFGPRTRATAFLAVTALVSYVGWWLSSFQIARHLLPTLAIVASLGGIGLAGVVEMTRARSPRALADVARVGLLLGCLVAPLFFVASPRARLPLDVLLGKETAAEYVEREVAAASALGATSELLPPDTPVGYISVDWEGPQLYSEARLMYPSVTSLGASPSDVLANLDRLGMRYLVWNRENSKPEQWRSILLSGEFLRDHARILAGDRSAYVIEVLPDAGTVWGADQWHNVLEDPEFTGIASAPTPWERQGKIKQAKNGISMPARSSVRQKVPVVGGKPYLLLARGSCANLDDKAELALQWFDDQGASLGNAAEAVIPGTETSEQFLWRRAPAKAASAFVELSAAKGADCEFEGLELADLGLPE